MTVFHLPDLIGLVLKDWLDVKAVVALDVALVNKKVRARYLDW